MQKKVAVIIPIYNVEKYLEDCLHSIIHQTYKNLEIILIDDGSTDASATIAKKYFDKDKRITIIFKSNGGQGSARNAGIEYIQDGFSLIPLLEQQSDLLTGTQTIQNPKVIPFVFQATLKSNALSANDINYLTGNQFSFKHSSFNVGGGGGRVKSNLCNIFSSIVCKKSAQKALSTPIFPYKPVDYTLSSCIVFSHSPTPPTEIEYIHFVDSDDMLSLDCIEKCINNIGECDIIWHDTKYIYEDNIPEIQHTHLIDLLHITHKEIENEVFDILKLWRYIHSFSWVHQGLFKISLLKHIRFSTPLANEDALFGMLLFAQATTVKISLFDGLIYRYHTVSVSGHGESQNIYRKNYPLFMHDIVTTFQNGYKIKHYYFAYSCTYVCLGLLAYIQMLDDSKTELKRKLIEFLQVRAIYAFGAMCFEFDPKHIRPLLQPLEPYMNKVPKSTKIAYFTPRLYRFLKWINKKRKGLRKNQ